MNDWAFTQPPMTLLDGFTAMPWKHYQQIAQDMTLDQVVIPSYNSSAGQKVITAVRYVMCTTREIWKIPFHTMLRY